jgi:hypothetical protein
MAGSLMTDESRLTRGLLAVGWKLDHEGSIGTEAQNANRFHGVSFASQRKTGGYVRPNGGLPGARIVANVATRAKAEFSPMVLKQNSPMVTLGNRLPRDLSSLTT